MGKERLNIREVFSQEEISLNTLFRIFWERKIVVVYAIIPFLIMGVIAKFTTPDEYTSNSTMLSETGAGKSSASGLSGLLGLSELGAASSDLSDFGPGLYPVIVTSRPFLLELMYNRFYFESEQDTLTLIDFLYRYDDRNLIEKLGLAIRSPGNAIRIFTPNPPLRIPSRDQYDDGIRKLTSIEGATIGKLKKRIAVSIDGRFITLRTTLPDAKASSQFNEVVFKKIIEYVEDYKLHKEREDLRLMEITFEESKKNFYDAQNRLAQFRDKNRNITLEEVKSQEARLDAEQKVAFGIYNTQAVQLEKKRVDLIKKKPLYFEFDPVILPNRPDRNLEVSMLSFFITGVLAGIVVLFAKVILEYFFKKKSVG